MEERKLKCYTCGVYLENKEVTLKYMDQTLHTDLPACPVCGQVYLCEELARGKVIEVEGQFEEK